MTRQALQIAKESAQAESGFESVERMLNAYVEGPTDGKGQVPIYGTAGLILLATIGAGPIRGMIVMSDLLYAVSGTEFCSVTMAGFFTNLATIPAGDLVDMATDGQNIVIVVPETGQILVWNGAAMTTIAPVDNYPPPVQSVDWLDYYFVFSATGTQEYLWTDLDASTTFNPLNFASAEWKPGNLMRVLVKDQSIFLMKEHSVEAAYPNPQPTVDNSDFLARTDVFIDVGLIGPQAAVSTNQTIFWLADDLTVRRLDAINATRVSTFPIERLIKGDPTRGVKGWANPSLTKATAHVWRGHLFIVFQNPDGCVVFDQATGLWHERQSYNSPTWRGRAYAFVYQTHVFGDAGNGDIYIMDPGAYDEAGVVLPFEVTFPFIYSQGQSFFNNQVELVMETGTINSQTKAASVQLAYTDDGLTWSQFRSQTLGKLGQYAQRVLFNRLGRSRGRAYRVRITDAVRRVLLSAFADIEGAES